MLRFSLTRSKIEVYASVRQKPVPKEAHMLRLHKPEAKNPLVVTSLASGHQICDPLSLLLPRAFLYNNTLSLLSRQSLVSLPSTSFLRRCHQLPPPTRSSSPIWLALFVVVVNWCKFMTTRCREALMVAVLVHRMVGVRGSFAFLLLKLTVVMGDGAAVAFVCEEYGGAGACRTIDGGAAAAVPDPMVTLLQWLPGAFSGALVRGRDEIIAPCNQSCPHQGRRRSLLSAMLLFKYLLTSIAAIVLERNYDPSINYNLPSVLTLSIHYPPLQRSWLKARGGCDEVEPFAVRREKEGVEWED
ncbi:hypothetical protein DEO72_LG8g1045 [Vigna unguiculata]|uniref:Uncharacterized protein n=1 Tax=Vigna unguiculata TaxID=3917 RepID=A0A4D6MPR1_VIGUN|nr:hypothetical protein DEO72_LG8g1045 [Vigna unguiculata]